MKRLFFLFSMSLLPLLANAYDVEVNGIYYYLNQQKTIAEVTFNNNLKYVGEVVIPSTVSYNGKDYSVTSIGWYAFYNCSGLTSITIPEGVTTIGDYAFQGCSGLSSITIPESVTSIGKSAFRGCKSLASIIVDENNIVYDSRNNCNAIIRTVDSTLIEGCNNTVIPESVTSIGNSAFGGCSGLTSMTIPESVTSIGNSAFGGCSGLTSIIIPGSVTSIGSLAFKSCFSLTSIIIPGSVTIMGEGAFEFCSSISSLTILEGVVRISELAFHGCSSLSSITIPGSVTSIGNYAFYECSGLSSITILDGVTSIGHHAFEDCSNLTTITIPESISYIPTNAFRGCNSLASIIVDERNIVYDSRNNCNAIIRTVDSTLIVGCNNTVIPESVTSIGDAAFQGRSGLTSIIIPGSVTSIGSLAFESCFALTSITIPESVIRIGNYAFSNCFAMTEIKSFAVVPPTCGSEVFDDINKWNCTLSVPENSIKDYQTAEQWKNFLLIVKNEDYVDSVYQVSDRLLDIRIENGTIIVSGLDDDEMVSVYRMDGILISTKTAVKGSAQMSISEFAKGTQLIIRIGTNTLKMMIM